MQCRQIPCKVFIRKKNSEQNNIHVDNRGMPETIPQNRLKISKILEKQLKEFKKIIETVKECQKNQKHSEMENKEYLKKKRTELRKDLEIKVQMLSEMMTKLEGTQEQINGFR